MRKKLSILFVLFLTTISHSIFAQGEVNLSGSTWTASVNNNTVYTGNDMINAIQSAINNLTPNRTTKQTVNIRNSGSTGIHNWDGDVKAINLRSYTVLNFHGNTIHVNDDNDNLIIPIRGRNTDHIEVRNLRITGNPRFAMLFKGCQYLTLSDIAISIPESQQSNGPGGGIRTEGGDQAWSGRWNAHFTFTNIFVEGSKGHGVELWRTDNFTIDTVRTRNTTGGAGLLLNQCRNGEVGLVDAFRANHGGGYAGFRTANDCGPNIHVSKVISRECGRGIFSVSQSRGITVDWVEISNCTGIGIFIEDSWDYRVNGGTVRNNGAEGVRLASRTNEHEPAQNVTIQNLCITGNHSYGIRETSSGTGFGNTNNNFFLNNDLRGSASNPNQELVFQGSNTVAQGNCLTNVPGNETTCGCNIQLDCNGVAGGNAYLDDCDVCVGGNTGKAPCVTTIENGFYTLSPFHSSLCLIPGNTITQTSCAEQANRVWEVTKTGNNYHFYSVTDQQYLSYGNQDQGNMLSLSTSPSPFRIENANNSTYHLVVAGNTNLLADVEGNSNIEGQAVLLWTRNNQNNQRFTLGTTSTDCNGDPYGTAFLDSCGTCVEGNTQNMPCTSYLDGPNACVYKGVIENNHTGHHGIGFLNGDNEVNNTIIWSLKTTSTGVYTIGFRHANGTAADRSMTLYANGSTIQEIPFSSTGAWNSWETVFVNIQLDEGANTLELVATTALGGPNFDLLSFYNEAITENSCIEDCNGDIGGTAFIDSCGNCAGGRSGLIPITDNNDCFITSTSTDVAETSIQCYPNPSEDVFYISTKGEFNYHLYTITGILIETGSGINDTKINQHLEKGIYILEVNNKTLRLVKK